MCGRHKDRSLIVTAVGKDIFYPNSHNHTIFCLHKLVNLTLTIPGALICFIMTFLYTTV